MSSFAARHEVTQLLNAASGGDPRASQQLLPLVYEELRKLARSQMRKEAPGQTMQATALVHEAYLRLVGDANVTWDGRGHFFGAAARAMRRILVERTRHKKRLKRGGDRDRQELEDNVAAPPGISTDLVALDEALNKLEQHDKRKAEVVMLRYFAGLSVEETAAAMGLSPATIKNEWTVARAWLHREMASASQANDTAGGGK